MKKTTKVRTKGRATEFDVVLGARLRAARATAQMTQQTLAEHLGVTFQTIQKYEKGKDRIAASRLVEIARVLDVPYSFFLGDDQGTAPRYALTKLGAELLDLLDGMPSVRRGRLMAVARELAGA